MHITAFKAEKKKKGVVLPKKPPSLVLTATLPAGPVKTYTIGFPFTTTEKEGDGETRTYTENVPMMKEKVMKLMNDLVHNKDECIMKKKTILVGKTYEFLCRTTKKYQNTIIFHEIVYKKTHCCTAKGKKQVDEAQAAIGDELREKLNKFLPKT